MCTHILMCFRVERGAEGDEEDLPADSVLSIEPSMGLDSKALRS